MTQTKRPTATEAGAAFDKALERMAALGGEGVGSADALTRGVMNTPHPKGMVITVTAGQEIAREQGVNTALATAFLIGFEWARVLHDEGLAPVPCDEVLELNLEL